MRMLRTLPFFPPKSGEKPYLEVLSRFGLWRDFLNDNIQANLVPRSLVGEAEGEIWQSKKICFS